MSVHSSSAIQHLLKAGISQCTVINQLYVNDSTITKCYSVLRALVVQNKSSLCSFKPKCSSSCFSIVWMMDSEQQMTKYKHGVYSQKKNNNSKRGILPACNVEGIKKKIVDIHSPPPQSLICNSTQPFTQQNILIWVIT